MTRFKNIIATSVFVMGSSTAFAATVTLDPLQLLPMGDGPEHLLGAPRCHEPEGATAVGGAGP